MKKLIFILTTLLAWTSATAATLTPDQALARLKDAPSASVHSRASAADALSLAHTEFTEKGDPAVYVFNRMDRSGYMLLAADDVAEAVLGYADAWTFSPVDEMPPALRWWLSEYASEIAHAKASGYIIAPKAYQAPEREVIAPMIKTRWDQGEPFYNQCPTYGTQRTYTGCVATTLAQVMKYWEYPERGSGSVTYTASTIEKRLTLDFSKKAFDWGNMIDVYASDYTQEQADAVAYLMKAAGFAVRMDYSTDASASLAMNVTTALKKYFKYDPNLTYHVRAHYTSSQWEQMMYENLRDVGPIPYGGASMIGGGHSFICDGYDGNGFFHFNWGWSGVSDGYFRLEALLPEALGVGGGTGGGYCFTQDAVLGVRPPTGDPEIVTPLELTQGGSLIASVENGMLTLELEGESGAGYINYQPRTLNVTFGGKFEKQGDASATPIYAPIEREEVTLKAGYGTDPNYFDAKIDLSKINLADGSYKVSVVTDIAEDTEFGWVPVRPYYGYTDHIILDKQGDTYTVKPFTLPTLRVVDAVFNTPLAFGCMSEITVTIANDFDIELTKGFAPVLFMQNSQGQYEAYFLGDSRLVVVEPKTSKQVTWITNMTPLVQITGLSRPAEMVLSFFDEATYTFFMPGFMKPVVMNPNPGVPAITFKNMVIKDAKYINRLYEGALAKIFTVNDKNNFVFEADFSIDDDVYFGYQMMACVLAPEPESSGDGVTQYEIISMNGSPLIMQRKKELCHFSTTMTFPGAKEGVIYCMMPAFAYGSSLVAISDKAKIYFTVPESAGIDEITADPQSNTTSTIYNLQGMSVGIDWDSLPPGIYIRDGKKVLKQQ